MWLVVIHFSLQRGSKHRGISSVGFLRFHGMPFLCISKFFLPRRHLSVGCQGQFSGRTPIRNTRPMTRWWLMCLHPTTLMTNLNCLTVCDKTFSAGDAMSPRINGFGSNSSGIRSCSAIVLQPRGTDLTPIWHLAFDIWLPLDYMFFSRLRKFLSRNLKRTHNNCLFLFHQLIENMYTWLNVHVVSFDRIASEPNDFQT